MDTLSPLGHAPDFAARYTLSREALLARHNAKWRQNPPDVTPAFVADMDFAVAPAIQAVIEASVKAQDYGYPQRAGKKADAAMCEAFARYMARRYAWAAEATQTIALADLVQGIYTSIQAFSAPGEGVIVQVPNYPPFRAAVEDCGRRFVPMPMILGPDGYGFDLTALEADLKGDERILMLCNPQNPTGRSFTRAELLDILAFAERHDLLIVSDEIHADLVYESAQHIPFPSLSEAAAARSLLLTSATKSFNIPGLRAAVMYFGTPELKARFDAKFHFRTLGSVNSIGIDATIAAWEKGDAWLQGLLAHLRDMRDHTAARLAAEMPAIRFQKPEATYLTWLDCSDLGIEGTAFEFFLREARVAFSPGENFLPGAGHCVRLNFATSKDILDDILDAMVAALRRNQR